MCGAALTRGELQYAWNVKHFKLQFPVAQSANLRTISCVCMDWLSIYNLLEVCCDA